MKILPCPTCGTCKSLKTFMDPVTRIGGFRCSKCGREGNRVAVIPRSMNGTLLLFAAAWNESLIPLVCRTDAHPLLPADNSL